MSKYNKPVEKTVRQSTTHQGGVGFTQTPEKELIGILATGLDNTYYENENDRDKRFCEVFNKIAHKDKEFAAKSLVYARTKFGQRTVTHRGAVELIPFLQGDSLGKRFFSKRQRNKNEGGVVYRIDDMTEILACYLAKNGNDAPIPNAIKKGFKDAIENADAYQLAKYQMKNKAVSLVDIVNLVHHRETDIQGTIDVPVEVYHKAVQGTKFATTSLLPPLTKDVEKGLTVKVPTLQALVLGILKQFNTVEDKNTEAGKVVAEKVKAGELTQEEAEKQLNEAKTDNFRDLIETKKIGYLALLRNLRNILKTNDAELLAKAEELLVTKEFIRKSLVWPHQIDLALEVLLVEFSGRGMNSLASTLGTAYELSIPNLKELIPEGKTAIVFDSSGSMQGRRQISISAKQHINTSPAEKAALVAATFAKGVGGDVYHFADYTKQIKGWNPADSFNSIKKEFLSHNGEVGYGTAFASSIELFERENKQYDRVIIISDCQDGRGWYRSGGTIEDALKSYSKKFGTPYVYIIDVTGYEVVSGKPGQRVFRMAGYTQDIYECIPQLEINPNVVIDEIKAINI